MNGKFKITNEKSANKIEAGELISIKMPKRICDLFKGMSIKVVNPKNKTK